MDLSIIIVNWNTRDLLSQCLHSVYTSLSTGHRPLTEVIVVDNGSSDGSSEIICSRFPQVHAILNSENNGFACASNRGIRASVGRYILLLNTDTIVPPGTLSNMTAFMETHPEAGILGANIFNSDRTPQRCFGRFPSLVSEAALAWGLDNRFLFSKWLGRPADVKDEFVRTDWVLGAALMVRREALDEVGLLDESYFMYSEEIDLARRVKNTGWKVFVLRDARIVHLGGQSARQQPALMKAHLFRSKRNYFEKHAGRIARSLIDAVFSASMLTKHFAYNVLGRKQLAALWAETYKHYRALEATGC